MGFITRRGCCAVVVLASLAGPKTLLWGQQAAPIQPVGYFGRLNQRCAPCIPCIPCTPAPAQTEQPKTEPQPQPMQPDLPLEEPTFMPEQFAATGPGDTYAASTPQIIGDFMGVRARKLVTINVPVIITETFTFTPDPFSGNLPPFTDVTRTATTQNRTVLIEDPVVTYSGIKIAENESPRPQTRAFIGYNYFANARVSGGFGGGTQLIDSFGPTPIGDGLGTITETVTLTSGAVPPSRRVQVHREMAGFEYAFLDGDASIGLRAPILQTDGGFEGDSFGKLSIIGKYALLNNPMTGDVVSCGLAVTTPSSRDVYTIAGPINSTLLQPYVGYILNGGNLFVQGFSSVVVPTSEKDLTLLFNDFGFGWWVRSYDPSRWITMIVPTIEGHITTPLDHRASTSALKADDLVVVTEGVHLGVGRHGLLTLGLAQPLTGFNPFDIEAVAFYNWRW